MRSRPTVILSTLICLAFACAAPAALAQGVQPRFDLSDPQGGPFPSDQFTVPDTSQLTGLRVNLPLPDCSVRPSDCNDIDVLNQLDGFNLQPRLSIPFTGPINPTTVSRNTVFLYKLGCLVASCPGDTQVGINQIVWDADTNTLYAESDQVLDQDARYLLVVTNGIRDTSGDRIDSDQFHDGGLHSGTAYTNQLLLAVNGLKDVGISPGQIAAASIFTTESATAVMEKIRDQLAAATPAPADFVLGSNDERTVFPLADVQSIAVRRQVLTDPALPASFTSSSLALGSAGLTWLSGTAGAVGTIAFGKYSSPDYETADGVIPAVGTKSGVPEPPGGPGLAGTNEIYFDLFLPGGPEPASGWPVVIDSHGGGGNKDGAPLKIAAKLAQHGLATITINAVGHGGGPLGTLTVTKTDGTAITFPAGGRGVDLNGDHKIDMMGIGEGLLTAAGGPDAIVWARDGLRQTVVDLMQLVREIQVGVDVNGDGTPDLDTSRVYYFGNSLGGALGTDFLALAPGVRAGVLGGAGASFPIDTFLHNAMGPYRGLVGRLLAARTPSLLNLPEGAPDPVSLDGASAMFTQLFPNGYPAFNENLPPVPPCPQPRVNCVPGAIAIQNEIERVQWAGQAGDPLAYVRHLRTAPLPGVPEKRVLFTFAQGDPVGSNTTTGNLLRAGELADRTIYFRGLDAYAALNMSPTATELHEFLLSTSPPPSPERIFANEGQESVDIFLASDGNTTINPGPFFETPFPGPLP